MDWDVNAEITTQCFTLPFAPCLADRLRELPAEDLDLPSQAIRCHLAGICASQQTGLDDVVRAMWKLLVGRSLLAIVRVRVHGDL